LYLVLDNEAVRLTEARWEARAVAVGSPKHSRYAELDIPTIRQRVRSSIGADSSEPLVGFFGQSPDIPGHEEAFSELLQAMTHLKPRPRLVLRAHPKFTEYAERHIVLAERAGIPVIDATTDSSAERWLLGCDVVATPYSACALDHAYLSAFSQEPIGVVVYLLCNAEIRAFMRKACGFERFPTTERGIGLVAERASDVLPMLQRALMPKGRKDYFSASKGLRVSDPCRKVLETVAASVPATAQGGRAKAC